MPRLTVVTRDGTHHDLEGENGFSVMEVVREGGIDEMAALCGGCCACATCHVHVDDAFLVHLPPMSDNENDLLEASTTRGPTSRLSCQIHLTDELDGLRVTVAAED